MHFINNCVLGVFRGQYVQLVEGVHVPCDVTKGSDITVWDTTWCLFCPLQDLKPILYLASAKLTSFIVLNNNYKRM